MTKTILAVLGLVILFAAPVTKARDKKAESEAKPEIDTKLSIRVAKAQVATALQALYDWDGHIVVNVNEVTETDFKYSIWFKGRGMAAAFPQVIFSKREGERVFPFESSPYLLAPQRHFGGYWCVTSGLEHVKDKLREQDLCWKAKDDNEAKNNAALFVAGVNRLIWENSPENQAKRKEEERAFEVSLATWRAGGSKVEPPEEAQRHFVLAQQAFQEKNFQKQAEELAAALVAYPTWPAEQYDLAVLLGELQHYPEAISHMNIYLELAPNAPDGEQVKRQIWIWQDKQNRH